MDRLRAHGNAIRHDSFAVEGHAFQIYWSFHPEAAEAVQRVGDFLRNPVPATP
ncbi:hypothetical protein [Nocardia seriolae]|uniref:hypothetical protein n=1 Tax=Nocardia seriolae TaxID=37332 RepID=UPI001E5649E4|nr:hypothetical protein [Nocardia seriolae]